MKAVGRYRFVAYLVLGAVGILLGPSHAAWTHPHPQPTIGGPLPTAGNKRPGVVFVLDRSGSMIGCDAGDPPGVSAVDKNCAFGGSTVTRLRALQLAMFQILDANGDGTISAQDEGELGIDIGVLMYDGAGTANVYTQAVWPIGTPYKTIWCGTDGIGGPDECDHTTAAHPDGQGFGAGGFCPGDIGANEVAGIQDSSPCGNTPTAEAMQIAYDGTVSGAHNGLNGHPACGSSPCCANCNGEFDAASGTVEAFPYGLQNACYDGVTNGGGSKCIISPLDANDDDAAGACRQKYMVVLSDGFENGVGEPHDVAKALVDYTNVGEGHFDGIFAIALGNNADFAGLNCLAREGLTDADLDGDGDPTTPGGACPAGSDPGAGYAGPGNAYQADDATELAAVFQAIVNEINTGLFSRTPPSISVPPPSAGVPVGTRAVHGATFNVRPQRIPWEGKSYKYLSGTDDTTTPIYKGLLDCPCQGEFPHPACTAGAPHAPDQDLDGDPTTGVDVDGDGTIDGFDPVPCYEVGYALAREPWYERNLFVALPTAATIGSGDDFKDLGKKGTIMGAGTGDENPGSANLDPGFTNTAPGNPLKTYLASYSQIAQISDLSNIEGEAAAGFGSMVTNLSPLELQFVMLALSVNRGGPTLDTAIVPSLAANYWQDARETIRFAAGNPQALAANDKCRTVSGSPYALGPDDTLCTGSGTTNAGNSPAEIEYGWKLGDIFEASPVVVPPPVATSSDPDYDKFLNCDDVGNTADCEVDEDGNGSADINYYPIAGCNDGSGKCAVKDRVRMLYVSTNDGWIHGFLDEENPVILNVPGSAGPRMYYPGEEVWAVALYQMLHKHGQVQGSHTYAANNDLLFRNVKVSHADDGSGRWTTVLAVTYRQGGPFVAMLDVTDPVAPRLMWEWRKPEQNNGVGNTFAMPTLVTLPPDTVGGRPYIEPAIYLPAGVFPDPPLDDHHQQLMLFHDPDKGKDKHHESRNGGKGLEDAYTVPPGIRTNFAARASFVDLDLDGVTERGYFGDTEGRLYKACNISKDGDHKIHDFADPAFFADVPPLPSGGDYESVTPVGGDPTSRGPYYYRPAVSRVGQDASGHDLFYVAAGSGNVNDPLQLNVPNDNYIMVYADRSDDVGHVTMGTDSDYCKDDVSCCAAEHLACNLNDVDADGLPNAGSGVAANPILPGRIRLHDMLTGNITIFSGVMIYTEFDPDQDNDGDVCEDDKVSRIHAFLLDGTGAQCIQPGGGAGQCDILNDPLDPDCGDAIFGGSPVVEFDKSQGIVSAPAVDPSTGTVYVAFSRPDAGNPVVEIEADLPSTEQGTVRSWRQLN